MRWPISPDMFTLTHCGRVTHICVSKPTTIGSDNGLSPGRRQAIIWTNAGILLIGPLGTNLSEILSEIYTFSLKKMHLKMSSGKWRPFCLGLNVLKGSVAVLNHIMKTPRQGNAFGIIDPLRGESIDHPWPVMRALENLFVSLYKNCGTNIWVAD